MTGLRPIRLVGKHTYPSCDPLGELCPVVYGEELDKCKCRFLRSVTITFRVTHHQARVEPDLVAVVCHAQLETPAVSWRADALLTFG